MIIFMIMVVFFEEEQHRTFIVHAHTVETKIFLA